MANNTERIEYVLENSGLIYQEGSDMGSFFKLERIVGKNKLENAISILHTF